MKWLVHEPIVPVKHLIMNVTTSNKVIIIVVC